MNLYLPPSIDIEIKYLTLSTWHDHVPFGYDIVAALRPEKVVELGTYSGMSFFAFCQAMQEQNIDGSVYAVDTWEGDEHTGNYGEDVFNKVNRHARDRYRAISYLLRMTFSEAAAQFDADSIDLLHIDGLHTYEAVREDFETWYPLVKPGGIILFHDIEARMNGFGVRHYWAELESEYTTFAFKHGYGLGVLRKPGGKRELTALEKILFEGDETSKADLRKLYGHVGRYLDALRRLRKQEQK